MAKKGWEIRKEGRIRGLIMKAEMGNKKAIRSLRILCREGNIDTLPTKLKYEVVNTLANAD